MLSDLLAGRGAFLGHSLHVLGGCRPHGADGWHLRLLLGLNLPLVCDLWHFVVLRIRTLPAVDSGSVGVHGWVPRGDRPLPTAEATRTGAELVSRRRFPETTLPDRGRRGIPDTALRHELPDVLAGGWARQQRLREELGNLAIGHEWMHANLVEGGPRAWVSGQDS